MMEVRFRPPCTSIEVNRRSRRAKTDRLDAGKLLAQLLRYHHGEANVWAIVRVPAVEHEDQRQVHRDLQEMKGERTRHSHRIKSLLATCGLPVEVDNRFAEVLPTLRCCDGLAVPTHLQERLLREFARWQLVDKQISEVDNRRKRTIRSGAESSDPTLALVRKLLSLKGVGVCAAWLLVRELFSWRNIANRRQLAALAGLTATPFDSGESRHEQGISKAGNRRLRVLLVELAWGWLRWQPNSQLSKWFNERFAKGNSRTRKIGIVALARKLLVALWQYLETGGPPEGAVVVEWQDKLKGGKRSKAQPAS